ncbi:hypothetical protein [Pseudoalteromonas peptidolytica]|uniref:Uncharacterized protein n=1 Tax=Pseudoalteromonas peptidolytica F12-50-A1 TaxID=1315280 RepID=A0A8I0T884_9GAMM|nr:hypothetical protein [Pseudoalteromonas peptidolytica]MBE0349039.1 hypothetical protein [Pseudoalteromonas peptidolytica F12-50-A1]NLR15864.1 hypothetical protein [Pseudoalteromonas peptidolytica]GEK11894.1 hypothetical protein PPE03_41430 [Pseudoalteromonas peptidolytica]
MIKNIIAISLFIGSFYLILTNQWGIGLTTLVLSAVLSKFLTGHYWFGFGSIFGGDSEKNNKNAGD